MSKEEFVKILAEADRSEMLCTPNVIFDVDELGKKIAMLGIGIINPNKVTKDVAPVTSDLSD